MKNLFDMLSNLHRPRLLIQAARIGASDYRRDIHLRRHLGGATLPRSGEALVLLMDYEAELNDRRTSHDASYSPSDHVEVLIAMMGEARVLRAAHPLLDAS